MTIDDLARLLGMIPAIIERLDKQNELLGRLAAAAPPRFVSVDEAAQMLGICKWSVRKQAAAGVLVSRRAGRRLLISADSIRPTDPSEIARLSREARS